MKIVYTNNFKKIIINICIISLIILFLINSNSIFNAIKTSTNIFIHNLVPALFIYIFITELLINSGKIYNLSLGISSILSKLFHIPKCSTSVVIISFLLGYPNASKYICTLYTNKQITTKEAIKLSSFTNNASPAYILATIGIGMFNNIKIGIILLISHFLSSIIIGITLPTPKSSSIIQQTNSNANTFLKISSPFEIILTSILNSLKTMGIIFAYTVIFSLIPLIIFKYFILPESLMSFLTGIFEISNGIMNISKLDIALNIKLYMISFILSFSSFMVNFQIYSYLYKTHVPFKDLLLFKTLQGIISCLITYIIINFIYTPTLPVFLNKNSIAISSISTYEVYIFCIVITIFICYFIYKKATCINTSPKKGDTHKNI